ncbi:hypothetical protein NPX13_g3497 [Xylaria arbuscula]|uniref:Uncharacterized protein n=1 Tax=Xylaria arbuscula TaxID=114810 RepID=A0A9W8NH65_9PEZI|nr:hypothetical protein NPX13_g3497 [Xylaria arbuscula]
MAENEFKVLVGQDKSTNVDIVFLGFGKKNFETWDTSANENHVTPWPREFLAGDIPKARISAYHYQAEEWKQYQKHAKDLCEKLDKLRQKDTLRHPIVLVAHSLAGLVVAKVLENTSICNDVQGLVFFATPFQEPNGDAPASTLTHIVDAYGHPDGDVMREAQVLKQLPDKVSKSERKVDVAAFVEVECDTALVTEEAIGQTHAKNYRVQSLMADHKDICKFKTKKSYYPIVSRVLREYAKVEEQEPERGSKDGSINAHTVHGGIHKDNKGKVHYINGETGTINFH